MIKTNKINDNIFQIRVIDQDEKNFHGCLFPVIHGTSYSCYLIIDEEITLIDTIEKKYFCEVHQEIEKILNDRTIDNIIINHVEPDHSGSFAAVMSCYPNAKIYTSKAGVKGMQEQFFKEYRYNPVGLGDNIKTGKYTLSFMETPLVHWPDNMWTYLEEEQILFSNDAFGQLLVDDVVYDSEISKDKLLDFSKEYYANIVLPNNKNVAATLTKFATTNWNIKLIAPSHGIMIKDHIDAMINQYAEFARVSLKKKAVIVYDTIWHNTETLANSFYKTLFNEGYEVKIYKLSTSRVSEVIRELIDTKLILIGTSNQNNCILPTVADFIERLKALKLENRQALVFGSYGWSPVPFNNLVNTLEQIKIEVITKPLIVCYKPKEEELLQLNNVLLDNIKEKVKI